MPTGAPSLDESHDTERGELHVVVLERDATCGRCLTRLLGTRGKVTIARSLAEGEPVLRTQGCHGLVADILLPDGCALDVMAGWRTANPRTPALIVSHSTQREHINAAQRLDVRYLVKPFDPLDLEPFVASIASPSRRLKLVVRALRLRYGLSQTENDIVLGAVQGEDRDEIAARRRCSRLTVRAHVASVLKRTGRSSLRDLVESILREAAGIREVSGARTAGTS
jgi:DNA-binding NarL/FixJ family response regulator